MRITGAMAIMCASLCMIGTVACAKVGSLLSQMEVEWGLASEEELAPDEDILGADWRTTGIIDSYVTFFDGKQDVELVVCVNVNEIAVYYDCEHQELFAKVNVPGISDEKMRAGGSITFRNLTGNSCDELQICFVSDDEEEKNYLYIWDGKQFLLNEN